MRLLVSVAAAAIMSFDPSVFFFFLVTTFGSISRTIQETMAGVAHPIIGAKSEYSLLSPFG
jgi:hypothetical protein